MSDEVLEIPDETTLGRVTAEELEDLKELAKQIRTEIEGDVLTRRQDNENVRYCIWEGQSPDGRKRKDFLGRDAKPFEGASDARIRTADTIVQERVMLDVAAAMRGMPAVTEIESNDAQKAAKTATLLRWITRNLWGAEWRTQTELLSQYRHGDTPAIGIAYVDWWTETTREYREISAEDALAVAIAQGRDPIDAGDLVQNPVRADELAALLVDNAPAVLGFALELKQARKAAAGIAELGMGRAAVAVEKAGQPKCMAMRAYEDVFYPYHTAGSIQDAPAVILRRVYTKARLLSAAAEEGWKQAFTDQVLEHEGESAFNDLNETEPLETGAADNTDQMAGKYEVLTAFYRATDDNGVVGIYKVTFSECADVAAKDRELWDRKHAKYPFIEIPRERLTRRLNDSRGIPELATTDQSNEKLAVDSFADHTQMHVRPPVLRPRGRQFHKVALSPGGEVEYDRNGAEIKWMEPPAYPQAADKMMLEQRRRLNEYWGRLDPQTQPNELLANLHSQHSVDGFLTGISEILSMTLQLCQQYMPAEQIARIVGGNGLDVERSAEAIQGKFDIQISFDVRDLDLSKAMEKPKLILENLSPFDRNGALPGREIILHALAQVYPNLADKMPTEDEASENVATDTKAKFAAALNGIEPPMPQQIDAPTVRLQVWQDEMEKRIRMPEAYGPVSPAARTILTNYLQYLTQQAQQMKNAEIGRRGAAPVTDEQIAEAAGVMPV